MTTGYIGLISTLGGQIDSVTLEVSEERGIPNFIKLKLMDPSLIGSVPNTRVDLRYGNISGSTNIYFADNPTNGDYITLNGKNYFFKNTFDILLTQSQVLIGDTLETTCNNLLLAINYVAPDLYSWDRYYNVDSANSDFFAVSLNSRTLLVKTLVSIVENNYGNGLTVSSSANTVLVGYQLNQQSAVTEGGIAADAIADNGWINVGSYFIDWKESTAGTIQTLYLPILNTHFTGVNYELRITFFDKAGYIPNENGFIAEFTTTISCFGGGEFDRSDVVGTQLQHYAAVLDLQATNTSIPEGNSITDPALIPYTGVIKLVWADMTNYHSDLLNHPSASSDTLSNAQITQNIYRTHFMNVSDYAVFMYVPNDNITTYIDPIPDWPSDVCASSGIWYLVGKYKDNYADIHVPINRVVSFWVGFGTPQTSSLTDLNLAKQPSSYAAEAAFEDNSSIT